jgi:hypothetical protein
MTSEQRLKAVASILTTGVLRLIAEKNAVTPMQQDNSEAASFSRTTRPSSSPVAESEYDSTIKYNESSKSKTNDLVSKC